MLQRSIPARSALPGRRVRVLVETDDPSTLANAGRSLPGLDVMLCSGPTSADEVCPLVAEGTCPLGACDVVVSDLRGPWAHPVREAWLDSGAVVTPASVGRWSAPADQLDAYLGAALTALYRAQYGRRPTAGHEATPSGRGET